MATPNIVPRADSEGGIGTASKYWGSAYIDLIYVGAGKIGRDADNLFDFSVDNEITFRVNATDEMVLNDSSLSPHANRGLSLGTSALRWKDLHLGDAAVINFNNHNVTLTHSDNALTLADGDYMQFGSSGDLQIYHSGASSAVNNTTGHLYISNGADDSDIIFQCDDGSGGVETYFMLDGSFGVTKFPDNKKLVFGNGLDVQVYHDGTNSYFYNQGGDLYIQNATDDSDIIFQSEDGGGGVTTYFTVDGSARDVVFAKDIVLNDNVNLRVGTGHDLQIYHDGTYNVIKAVSGHMLIKQDSNDQDIILQSDDGAGGTTTYFSLDGSSATHDGSATTALYTNWPDKSRISLGTSHDLQIVHNATDSYIHNHVGDLYIKNTADDKDIIFQSDDGSGGVTAYLTLDGSASLNKFLVNSKHIDNVKAIFGDSDDLQIYHDGSNSYISDTGTGSLLITGANDVNLKTDTNERMVQANANGSVQLFYDNVEKLATSSDGVAVTGKISATSSTDPVLNLNKTGGGNAALHFEHDGVDKGYIYVDTSSNMHFGNVGVNPTFEITADGKVGVGTTVPGTINSVAFAAVGLHTNYGAQGRTITEGSNSAAFIMNDSGANADERAKFIKSDNGVLSLGKFADNGTETAQLSISNGGDATFAGDVKLAATKKLYLDGGTHTYITESSADTLQIVTAGTITAEFAGTALSLRNTQVNGTLTVGVNDTGHDVKFYGATAGSFLLWDESDDSLKLTDSTKLKIGDSADLEIYHDGSNSYIKEVGAGTLRLQTNGGGIDLYKDSTEFLARFITDGAAELYYDSVKKLETTSAGVTVTGTVSATSYKTGSTTVLQGDADVILGSSGSTGTISLTTHTSVPFKIENDDSISMSPAKIVMTNLPTSDPGTTGQLWNDNGTLKISAGG